MASDEVFVRVRGYPMYQVSNYGRVYSEKTNRILKNRVVNGYEYVSLSNTAEGDQRNQYVHRLVATAFIDNPCGKPVVDHIDGDKSNNNVRNLRWATSSENAANMAVNTRRGSSQYKGVGWDRRMGKWRSRVCTGRKEAWIGHFDDEEAAARAYDIQARRMFGEHACLNFPEP